MKHFQEKEICEALEFVTAGGQALHIFKPTRASANKRIPLPFRRTKVWAHLLDLNKQRLVETARKLGVKIIVIDCKGGRGQHVDLCGRPLERAIKECQGE